MIGMKMLYNMKIRNFYFQLQLILFRVLCIEQLNILNGSGGSPLIDQMLAKSERHFMTGCLCLQKASFVSAESKHFLVSFRVYVHIIKCHQIEEGRMDRFSNN